MADVQAYLDSLILQVPDLGNDINELIDFHKRRLWHQLTEKAEFLVKQDQFRSRVDLGVFYTRFLLTFAQRINQVSFVRTAIAISTQSRDVEQRKVFLRTVSELPKVQDASEAVVIIKAALAENLVETKALNDAKDVLDSAKKTLDETLGADATVFAAYHHGCAVYYKAKEDAGNFYQSALQYVGYTNLETLSRLDVLQIAVDLGLAALTAEKVYNFGDLMESEIVDNLKGSDFNWLWEVLQAFNRGDIAAWNQLQNKYAAQLNAQPGLIKNNKRLSRKISILALMEMVFSKPSDDRIVSFAAIGKATELPVEDVELLVMHGFSLGLIKGSIDQVEHLVDVTWVQPRILAVPQIEALGQRLSAWGEHVQAALSTVQGSITPELIA